MTDEHDSPICPLLLEQLASEANKQEPECICECPTHRLIASGPTSLRMFLFHRFIELYLDIVYRGGKGEVSVNDVKERAKLVLNTSFSDRTFKQEMEWFIECMNNTYTMDNARVMFAAMDEDKIRVNAKSSKKE